LHDIGKISVPDRILNKSGKLTDDEFSQMEQHSIIGGNILLDLYEKTEESYLLVASQVAMYHHEKWDGSGYPKGLQGDNIPVAARIVALADVYDAISSKRCYKESLDHTMVKDIILKGKGRHFDPRVVEAFLRHEDIWLTIRKRYADNG
jgi:putative two-component system response regulator